MINKLRSNSGESIAETMVSVLISALALLMLAGTINSASKIITDSKEAIKKYYMDSNVLAVHPHESGSPKKTVTVSGYVVSNAIPINITESWDAFYSTFNDILSYG